jgi:drug/metabolite transporter (DMT)-like permease
MGLRRVTSIVLALTAAFLFGLALVLAKVGLRYIAPLSGAAIAIMSATALFVGIALVAMEDVTPVWAAVPIFATIGLMSPAAVALLTFAANRALGPVMTGAFGNLAPLFAVTIAFVILDEVPRMLQLGGLLAIVVGIVILTGGRGGHGSRSWFLLLPLAAAALRGATQATVKLGLEIWPSPFAAALVGYLVSTVVVLIAARIGTGRFVADAPARGILWCTAVGWCNGLAALLMYAALAHGPVALVSPLVATYPLVTVVISMLLFGRVERGMQLALGVALTVVGVALLIVG